MNVPMEGKVFLILRPFYVSQMNRGCWRVDMTQRQWICVLWLHIFCAKCKGSDPVNRFNHASWAAVATPTDRPDLVQNRCVIEGLVVFLCLHFAHCVFCGCKDLCHRTESYRFLCPFLSERPLPLLTKTDAKGHRLNQQVLTQIEKRISFKVKSFLLFKTQWIHH